MADQYKESTETPLSKHEDRIWSVFSLATAIAAGICLEWPNARAIVTTGILLDVISAILIQKATGRWNANEYAGTKAGAILFLLGTSLIIIGQWM